MTDKLLLRVGEAARLAGCGRSTAYELLRKKEWPSVMTPYGLRVPAKELEEWVERQSKA
jgi:excisionase family DNA binding protein